MCLCMYLHAFALKEPHLSHDSKHAKQNTHLCLGLHGTADARTDEALAAVGSHVVNLGAPSGNEKQAAELSHRGTATSAAPLKRNANLLHLDEILVDCWPGR